MAAFHPLLTPIGALRPMYENTPSYTVIQQICALVPRRPERDHALRTAKGPQLGGSFRVHSMRTTKPPAIGSSAELMFGTIHVTVLLSARGCWCSRPRKGVLMRGTAQHKVRDPLRWPGALHATDSELSTDSLQQTYRAEGLAMN